MPTAWKDFALSFIVTAAVMTPAYWIGTSVPFFIFSLFAAFMPILVLGAIFYLTPLAALTFGICEKRYGVVAGCCAYIGTAYLWIAVMLSMQADTARAFENRTFAAPSMQYEILRLPEERFCDSLCLQLIWESGASVAVHNGGDWQVWRKVKGTACLQTDGEDLKHFPEHRADTNVCAVESTLADVADSLEIRGSEDRGYQEFRYRTRDARPTNFYGYVYELYERRGRKEALLGRWIHGEVSSLIHPLALGLFPGPISVGQAFERTDFYGAVAKLIADNSKPAPQQ
jgi:hypothetical protein